MAHPAPLPLPRAGLSALPDSECAPGAERDAAGRPAWQDSPGWILLVLVLTTFGVELAIMAVFYSRGRPTSLFDVVLDPTLHIVFLGPALFFLVIQPFRRKAARQVETERVLRRLNVELGREVSERKRAEEDLILERNKLRKLSARLEAVREAERRTIAREVHDELGQALTGLKLDLGYLLRHGSKGGAGAAEKLRSMSGLLDETIVAVQRICRELRPGLLDDLGPAAAFEWQAREFEERTGIACELSIEPKEIACDVAAGTALFRVFQEALTNVARHSGADLVEVNLRQSGSWVTMTVRDNGRGITPDQVAAPSSLGLLGIRERAAQLGGEATIAGSVEGGTTVTLEIPTACEPAEP